MATKNNRRILVTKKILKDSLMELMKEKPISKITIKEICDLSEIPICYMISTKIKAEAYSYVLRPLYY